MIPDLFQFLLDRIVEVEELAREADRVYVHPGAHDPMFGARPDDEIASRYWDRVADPDRVLAGCEVNRMILVHAAMATKAYRDEQAPMKKIIISETVDTLTDVLRFLALPYADHPQFQEEWRV